MTPLLAYFQSALFNGPKGKLWGSNRLSEAKTWIEQAGKLAGWFEDSVNVVERKYRNYQPFYPVKHTFGVRGRTTTRHGDELRATVDVAARLAKREVWHVGGNAQLDFRYLDRELPLTRAKPRPTQDPGSMLEVDLFLANAYDRTPILGEVKLRKDQCPFYALIQLLTQAAYAVTSSQRERLVLFGSEPDFVLRETVHGKPEVIDLYLLLIDPPDGSPYGELRKLAIELSKKLIADQRVGSRIGRIAWIEGTDRPPGGFAFEVIELAASRLRRPRKTPLPK